MPRDTIDIAPKPLGYVPIYKETKDERILAYLRQNAMTHDLVKEIPSQDVLRNLGDEPEKVSPHETSEGFNWELFWKEFLAFFGCMAAIFAMFYIFAAIWGVA